MLWVRSVGLPQHPSRRQLLPSPTLSPDAVARSLFWPHGKLLGSRARLDCLQCPTRSGVSGGHGHQNLLHLWMGNRRLCSNMWSDQLGDLATTRQMRPGQRRAEPWSSIAGNHDPEPALWALLQSFTLRCAGPRVWGLGSHSMCLLLSISEARAGFMVVRGWDLDCAVSRDFSRHGASLHGTLG